MQIEQLEVNKKALGDLRMHSLPVQALNDGEIRVAIDRFALTANNITYGVVGEKIGYWQFFPCEAPWGVIPVWGFADVVESRHGEVTVGERLYGYWPMGTHLTLAPGKVSATHFFDAAAHRDKLPPVYNRYSRCSHEAHYDSATDDARMLLFPLYATSYCLYDYLIDNDYFGAQQVIIPSASSKTAIGLAYALADDDKTPPAIGVTSAGNMAKVEALGVYQEVVSYDQLDAIDASKPSVIVDMSGNGAVLSALHRLLGDNMRFTSNVGITHYDDNDRGPDFIRERSEMFFAPAHMQKRSKDWGPGEFEKRAFAFWHSAAKRSDDWLRYRHVTGSQAMQAAYNEVLSGKASPDVGIIITPSGE